MPVIPHSATVLEPRVRPQLKPALRLVWRDTATVQIGVDPERAVILSGLDPATAQLIESLDGSRSLPELLALAGTVGIESARMHRLLDVLDECGVLDDAAYAGGPLADLTQHERDRLTPDLASLSLTHGGAAGGASAFARRRAAKVAVHGAGRVGAAIAGLLGAAGIGRVEVHDSEPARAADICPAGLGPDSVGTPRGKAVGTLIRTLNPSTRVLVRSTTRPDAAVLAPATGASSPSALAERLVRQGVPHLWVGVREGLGVIGPLVVPGRSSCLRCHDLHRADRDPGWASVAAQLAAGRRGWVEPCDTTVAVAVAAIATMQLLALLDCEELPPAVDGTIEVRPPMGGLRRRSWSMHPLCGCQWANVS
jgi:hypothetical protein